MPRKRSSPAAVLSCVPSDCGGGCISMKEPYKSRVYTDRPSYADFDAPAKIQAIQSIVGRWRACRGSVPTSPTWSKPPGTSSERAMSTACSITLIRKAEKRKNGRNGKDFGGSWRRRRAFLHEIHTIYHSLRTSRIWIYIPNRRCLPALRRRYLAG